MTYIQRTGRIGRFKKIDEEELGEDIVNEVMMNVGKEVNYLFGIKIAYEHLNNYIFKDNGGKE